MKKLVSRTVVLAVALGVASLAFGQDGSWTGWVTDNHCGAKGASATHAECAAKCVKEKGAKWALYTPADKGVWELSDQEGAAKMAGKEVMVKGKMDAAKKMIAVTSMTEAAAAKKM
jgi:hypothetical protein